MPRRSKRKDIFTLELDLYQEPDRSERAAQISVGMGGFNFLDPHLVQIRRYQLVPSAVIMADGKDYGFNMATGLGKTVVAFTVMDEALIRGRVVILAPTTALCNQHFEWSKLKFIKLEGGAVNLITGDTSIKRRKELYEKSQIVVATPQTFLNDLKAERATLHGVTLVVFDEMHLASRSYAYVGIAEMCRNLKIQVLGLTASAGGTKEKRQRVKQNLGIESWVRMSLKNDGVKLWRYPVKRQTAWIPLSPGLTDFKKRLLKFMEEIYRDLAYFVKLPPFPIEAQREIEIVNKRFRTDVKLAGEDNPDAFRASSTWSTYVKLQRLLLYLITEGFEEFLRFTTKIYKEKGMSSARIFANADFAYVFEVVRQMTRDGVLHPKQAKLLETIKTLPPASRNIIFCRYIESNRSLVRILNQNGLPAVSFMGKKELPTKAQTRVISDFEAGIYREMVSTSAGQMGLDIPSIDNVIHYSMPLNGGEMIQRDGRCGRHKKGQIFYLPMDEGTDKALYWYCLNEKRSMAEEADRDSGTLMAEALDAHGVFQAVTHQSIFSERPRKEKDWASEIALGNLVHDRFLVKSVGIRSSRRFGPYVRIELQDKTGSITLFHNCSGIAQAQDLTGRVTKGKVVIVSGEAKEYGGEVVLVVDPKKNHYIVLCPEGDYAQEDYKIPPDDF